jgi:hypothetical protein
MTKTNRPIVRIYQGNDEFIDREMNDTEFAQYEIDQANALAVKAEAETKEAARQALLEKLGITADEAKLLLG